MSNICNIITIVMLDSVVNDIVQRIMSLLFIISVIILPAIIMFIMGFISLKKNPTKANYLFAGATIYFIIAMGIYIFLTQLE